MIELAISSEHEGAFLSILKSSCRKFAILSALIFVGAGHASAEVSVAERATQNDMTIRITNDTRQAAIDKLAKTFDFKVTGQVTEGEPITAVMRGDLKSITARLLGENAVTLVYGPLGVEELIVVNGSDSTQQEAGVPRIQVSEAKSEEVAGDSNSSINEEAGARDASADLTKENVLQDKIVKVRPAVPNAATESQPPAAMFTDVDDETFYGTKDGGKGVRGNDPESMAKQSEASLNALTKALQALCPPDQNCR